MKIIHTADLHLDSKMESNLPKDKAKVRKNELLSTFNDIVSFAKTNDVKAVILAGDIFDGSKVTVKSKDFFFDCINSAPNIDFLYLVGNHDELSNVLFGRDLPGNLKVFGKEWTEFNYGSVSIKGLVITSDNAASFYNSLINDNEKVNIVVLHGQESQTIGDGLIKINELKDKYIDYLALGHIHSYKSGKIDQRGVYTYSGCPEGRGFDECGDKGFVLLEIDDKSVKQSFHSVSKRKLHEVPVDISGLVTMTQIYNKISETVAGISKNDMVKVVLTGSYSTDAQKSIEYIDSELNRQFFFAKVKDESTLEINAEDYLKDVSLKGEFIRTVLASDLSKTEQDQIIMFGLKALSGEEIE